jgi:NADH-quinone oxidoreductase subunit G
VYRFLPRLNPDVNDYWLCDHGRFLSESLNLRDVSKASAREGASVRDLPVPAAVARIATEIRAAIDSKGASSVFFLGSPHLSNEENFLLRKLADHLGCPNRDVTVDEGKPRRIKSQKGWITGEEAAPNFRGAREMGMTPGRGGSGLEAVLAGKSAPEVVVVADAGFGAAADDAAAVAALRKAKFLAVLARTSNALTRAADVVLPAASLAEKEGTFTNLQGRAQKFERAFLSKPPVRAHWELLLMLANALGYGDAGWTPADLRGQIAKEVPGYEARPEKELDGGRLLKKGDFAWKGPL